MGDRTMAVNGLLFKISSLFNSSLYSDVQFVFPNESGTDEIIYCHKLILALQSKAFAHLLFENKKSLPVIKMQASKKQLFYLLFKFLYTNDVQFHSFNEAQDLCELASDYCVEELVRRCHDYMFQSGLTIETIFLRYDHALKIQNEMLLKDCRNFVCSNVQVVLQPDEFSKASHAVVEDIVQLDVLPVTTELEIINAVLNWGSESLIKHQIPYDEQNLRKSIDPFLKHLRILSLSSSEFQDLVENFNIFSAYESTIIISKIIMPDSSSKLPESFCPLTSKRSASVLSRKTSFEHQQYHSNTNSLLKTDFPESIPPRFQKRQQNPLNTNSSVKLDLPKSLLPYKSPEHQQTHFNSSRSVKSDSPKSVRSDTPKSLSSSSNKISYEVRKYPAKNASVSSSKLKQNFNSSPNILDIPTPSFSQNCLRDLVFPLRECTHAFNLSFKGDLKCCITIKMKSGNLSLYGFELRIKNKSEKKEKLEVCVDLQGFSTEYSEFHDVELHSNVVCITFPPVKLQQGKKGQLEVCIEDLYLHRCSQIDMKKKSYVLNCGLDFQSEISVDSNKSGNEGNFLFFINKLIYAPF